MSRMSDLHVDLCNLQDAALDAAENLAQSLQAISDLYWGSESDAPIFRASTETLEILKSIELLLAVPAGEIKSAA
jgi:hypothetical protein